MIDISLLLFSILTGPPTYGASGGIATHLLHQMAPLMLQSLVLMLILLNIWRINLKRRSLILSVLIKLLIVVCSLGAWITMGKQHWLTTMGALGMLVMLLMSLTTAEIRSPGGTGPQRPGI